MPPFRSERFDPYGGGGGGAGAINSTNDTSLNNNTARRRRSVKGGDAAPVIIHTTELVGTDYQASHGHFKRVLTMVQSSIPELMEVGTMMMYRRLSIIVVLDSTLSHRVILIN